jgi:hypothetical protein
MLRCWQTAAAMRSPSAQCGPAPKHRAGCLLLVTARCMWAVASLRNSVKQGTAGVTSHNRASGYADDLVQRHASGTPFRSTAASSEHLYEKPWPARMLAAAWKMALSISSSTPSASLSVTCDIKSVVMAVRGETVWIPRHKKTRSSRCMGLGLYLATGGVQTQLLQGPMGWHV